MRMAAPFRRSPGRHAAGRAPTTPAPSNGRAKALAVVAPATLLVRPEVLRTIAVASASAAAGRHETGGPLVGTVQGTWNGTEPRLLVSILGTVPPGPAARAGAHWVEMGSAGDGERAASALRWWRAVSGLDLRHLGDWHLHHPAGPEPSEGDRRTAAGIVAAAAPVWLVAVAVAHRLDSVEFGAERHVARMSRASGAAHEVRFYRRVPVAGLRAMPVRVEGTAIPGLPTLPWHVADPIRFAVECRLLRAAGFSVAVDAVRPDRRLGLAVRLQRSAHPPITVLTGVRYPFEAPATVDGAGRVKVRSPWAPGRFLVDLAEEESR